MPNAVTACKAPFRAWVIDDVSALVPASLCRDAYAAVPPCDWPGWCRYDNALENRKRTARDRDELPAPCGALLSYLSDNRQPDSFLYRLAAAIDFGELLTIDPYLHGAGIHVTDPGGWLQVHGDYELHPLLPWAERRLSLVLYLNPSWESHWGGETLLCDGMGAAVEAVMPAPGRALVFEGGNAAFHGCRPTSPDAPPRVTAAVYYLGAARPSAHRRRAMFLPNRDAADAPPRELAPPAIAGPGTRPSLIARSRP